MRTLHQKQRMLCYLEADKTKIVIFVPTNLVTFCWLYKSKNIWVVIFVSAGGRVEAGGEGVRLLGAGSHDAGWPGSLPQQSHALRQGEHEWGCHITSGAIRQQSKLPAGQDHYGSFLLQMQLYSVSSKLRMASKLIKKGKHNFLLETLNTSVGFLIV